VIPNLFGGGQLSRCVSVTVPANCSDRRALRTLPEIAKRANVSTATFRVRSMTLEENVQQMMHAASHPAAWECSV
jgi:hypothetical protein